MHQAKVLVPINALKRLQDKQDSQECATQRKFLTGESPEGKPYRRIPYRALDILGNEMC